MRESKRRALRFNMGPWESHEVTAWVELDHTNEQDQEILKSENVDPLDPEAVADYIDWRLDNLIAQDVADAKKNTTEGDSFVYPYFDQHYKREEKR